MNNRKYRTGNVNNDNSESLGNTQLKTNEYRELIQR